jgi:membrane protease YdiL (CAAX protease family)
MRALVQKLSPVQEAILITTIFAGWFIFSALLIMLAGFPTVEGGSFDDAAALSLVVFECIAFVIGAVVLRWRGWTLGDFAFRITGRHVLAGLVLLGIATAANWLVWLLAGTSLDNGSMVREIFERTPVSLGVAVLVSLVNGTFEEFFLCRYLIERFQASGATFAVTLSAGIRMLYHVYQGPFGTLSILAFGLIIGTYYWRTRALGAVVVTHILADLIALA